MIEYIKIDTMCGIIKNLDITIIPNKNVCYLNNKKYNIDDDFIDKLIRIIRNWETSINNTNIIDSEECIIIIKTDSEENTIDIKGNYPNNYGELFNLFEELQNE